MTYSSEALSNCGFSISRTRRDPSSQLLTGKRSYPDPATGSSQRVLPAGYSHDCQKGSTSTWSQKKNPAQIHRPFHQSNACLIAPSRNRKCFPPHITTPSRQKTNAEGNNHPSPARKIFPARFYHAFLPRNYFPLGSTSPLPAAFC